MSLQHKRGEEEQLQIHMADTGSVAPKSCTPGWIFCAILILITAGTFSFCLFYHHVEKDSCYAHATFDCNKTEWKWNMSRCTWALKGVNKTVVKIISPGVYITDIQVFSSNMNKIMDIGLKMIPSSKTFIGGSFPSARNSSYAKMYQILVLNKEDKLDLTVNGNQKNIGDDPRTTYWKILKVKDL